MAARCDLCGKGPMYGSRVSHAHNVTHRRFEPNLQRIRAYIGGGFKRIRVCTRCIRTGVATKHKV
ncbi:MAG: 50S ribosomal protein L28 [Acidobacteria bacterium]|nr:50S ribosomal protein L28 [Acidobacteriota bacterium]